MPTITIEGFSCACGNTEFDTPKDSANRMVCVKCRTPYEFIPKEDILIRAPRAGKCRGCQAPIRWITMKDGESMPVNSKPRNFVVLEGSKGEIVKGYVPHWATCPERDKFKGKG